MSRPIQGIRAFDAEYGLHTSPHPGYGEGVPAIDTTGHPARDPVAPFPTLLTDQRAGAISARFHAYAEHGLGLSRMRRTKADVPVDFAAAYCGDWAETFRSFEAYLQDESRPGHGDGTARHAYVSQILARDPNRDGRALACLHAAHAASVSGRDARTVLRLARRAKRGFPIERDPLAHAAALRLVAIGHKGDDTPFGRRKAIELLQDAADLKIDRGFDRDCVPEFIVLSDLCRREGRYKEAIAHMRRAVYCARGSGKPADGMNAHLLEADLYVLLRQSKKAGVALAAAESLRDFAGSYENLKAISRLRSIVDGLRPPLGPTTACVCKSGLPYQRCCGTADAEPIELALYDRVGDGRRRSIRVNAFAAGNVGRALDVIVRKTDAPVEGRVFTILTNDGRHDLRAFPDIATRALASARTLAELAREMVPDGGRPENTGLPLAVVLQCACALEAFINAVAYFISLDGPSVWGGKTMPDLFGAKTDAYQKNTQIVEKWLKIGGGLFDVDWLPKTKIDDLKFLIHIRKELVHFKTTNVEAVIIEEDKAHPVIRYLPEGIILRPSPGTWVDRLFGADFASWAVTLSEGLIESFRMAYVEKYGDPNAVR